MALIKQKAVFCWSGGKDSALCLYEVLSEGRFEVCYLLTTLNENFRRISMHGVREDLLDLQAASIGIPLLKVFVSTGTNLEYEQAMEKCLLQAYSEGIEYVIFGDIFLEDLRKYRETNLAKIGMKGVFPLWKKGTKALIGRFLSLGFKTITCCVNDMHLGKEYVGVEVNDAFVESLPEAVDPCGENGEFHTFCYAGPVFKKQIGFLLGESIYRPLEVKTQQDAQCNPDSQMQGFWFCELIPSSL
jgi:uncharacterized protein (TIGR00290 family)